MRLPELHTSGSDRFIRFLFQATGVLIVVHLINLVIGGPSWQLERLFALGEENNIPTWFSSLIWGLSAFAAYRCSTLVDVQSSKTSWICLSILFLSFSIDEIAMIHESFFGVMSRFTPQSFQVVLSDFRASNWPIIAAPFLVLALIWLNQIFKRLAISRSAWKLIGFGLFLVIFGGFGLEITINFLNHNELQWLWEIESVFEESFEIIGSIFILSGLLNQYQYLDLKIKALNLDSSISSEAKEHSFV